MSRVQGGELNIGQPRLGAALANFAERIVLGRVDAIHVGCKRGIAVSKRLIHSLILMDVGATGQSLLRENRRRHPFSTSGQSTTDSFCGPRDADRLLLFATL